MINLPAIRYIEEATGKKMPSLMADKVDISERTLRTFPFSNKTLQKIKNGSHDDFKRVLKSSGYLDHEINEILANHPKSPYAGIIYEEQEASGLKFPHAIVLARKIDDLSSSLVASRQKDDIEEVKSLLMQSEFSNHHYLANTADEWINERNTKLLNWIESAQGWGEVDGLLKVLTMHCLLSLMACWDLEFYCQYSPRLSPKSWFSLVLPKVDPLAEYINANEIKKKRGLFWYPTKRLIDLISCFGKYSQRRGFPDEIPQVSDGAFWRNESEQNLVNWRDGTKRFLYRDFMRLWEINSKDIVVPSPVYVAAKMWEIYFVKIDANLKTKTILLMNDWYHLWWEKHYTDLTSDLNLTSQDKDHWPKCFDMI